MNHQALDVVDEQISLLTKYIYHYFQALPVLQPMYPCMTNITAW
jgi:hypothetical protein